MRIVAFSLIFFTAFCLECGSSTLKNPSWIVKKTTSTTPDNEEKWVAAVFRNLKIGVSQRSQAISELGQPDATYPSDMNDRPINSDTKSTEIQDTYENIEFYGQVILTYDNNVISEIICYPKSLSVERAVTYFGHKYRKVRYEIGECPGDAGSSQLYESQTGQFKYLEFPSKGISIKLDGTERSVEEISFLKAPVGIKNLHCE